jgi:maltose alpha-D-glucosyltransferase/alpha-amylase
MMPSSEVASSVRFGERFVLKLFANIETGIHPGVEIGEVLNTPPSNFSHAAPLAGHMVYESSTGETTTLAVLHGFVPNSGDAWQRSRQEVDGYLLKAQAANAPGTEVLQSSASRFCDLKLASEPPAPLATELIGPYLTFATTLGQRTAELHLQLTKVKDNPAFAPEVFNDFYRQGLYHGYVGLTGRRLEFLRQHYAEMRPDARALAEKVLEQEAGILLKFNAIYEQRVSSVRSRFHGRLHLGHMLVTGEDDAVIFDFEGDPALHLSERRIKRCPLRDVASMLISFGYSAQASIRSSIGASELDKATEDHLRIAARFWYSHVSAAFLRGYLKTAEEAGYLPKTLEQQQILIDAFLLERALLDIRADIQSKPELAGMQFRIILHLLDKEDEFQPGKPA